MQTPSDRRRRRHGAKGRRPDASHPRAPATIGDLDLGSWIFFGFWFLVFGVSFPLSAATPALTTNSRPTFHAGLKVATEAALADQSLVLLVFGADWCPPCKALKKDTLASPQFLEGGGSVRVTEIDIDADEATASRFGVSAVPTLFLLTADAKIVARQSGYLDSAALLRWLEEGRRRARAGQWEGSAPGFKLEALLAKASAGSLETNDLAQLVGLLGERDPGERTGAERLLLAQREKAMVPLIDALLDPYLGTRIGASDALQRLAPNAPRVDPWLPVPDLAAPVTTLRQWWSETRQLPRPRSGTNDAVMTGSIQAALEGLIGDDPVRRTDAMSTLSSHGSSALPAMRAAIKRHERSNPRAVALLEDVRWSILIPDTVERKTGGVRSTLARGASGERQTAAGRLGRAGRDAIDALGELLNDSDPLVVESAVRALSSLGGADVLPALAALLKAADSNLRMTAAQALGRTRLTEATPHLLPAFEDPNEVVATAAISALVAVNATDEKFTAAPGAKEELGDDAVSTLKKACADSRWRVRAAAVEAAGKLKVGGAAPEAIRLLADPDEFVVKHALMALAALEQQPEPDALIAVGRRLPSLLGEVTAMVAKTASGESVQGMIALYDQLKVPGRVALLAGLGRRERFDDTPLDEAWKPLLLKAAAAPEPPVRRELALLLRLAAPKLAGEIVGGLVGDDDAAIRDDAALVALGALTGHGKTAVRPAGAYELGMDLGEMGIGISGRTGQKTNEPPVKPEQAAAWHQALERPAIKELTPLTATLFYVTGDSNRELSRLVDAFGRAPARSLEALEESPAIAALAPRLPWPESRPLFEHLARSPGLYIQAAWVSTTVKPGAAEYLLDPTRLRQVIERASGDTLKRGLQQLLTESSGEHRTWSLMAADVRTRRVVDELSASTNAAWRAASLYVLAKHGGSTNRARFEAALQDRSPWVRAAAAQALARIQPDRDQLEARIGPLLDDSDPHVAGLAALSLLGPALRNAAGLQYQFGYFHFEDVQAGSGDNSNSDSTEAPTVLTNKPPYLAQARRQLARLESDDAVPMALLLAQHGEFDGVEKIMASTPDQAPEMFSIPNALLAAVALSNNPKFISQIREWTKRSSNEWELRRLLAGIKGMTGPEARQLRLDLNRRIRMPGRETVQ